MIIFQCICGAICGAIVGYISTGAVGFLLFFFQKVPPDGNWDAVLGSMASYFVPIGILIGIITPIYEAVKENKLKAKRKKDVFDTECKSLAILLNASKDTFLSLNQLASIASGHLDNAEREFEEGAFAPFWDEVENATNSLAAYHQKVNTVEHNATAYAGRASKLRVSIPKFDMPKGELLSAYPVAVRLSKVVRQAQKDFQFATIYEQRKTNQLLYAGFETLALAINVMQVSIHIALEDLSTSLNTTLFDLYSASNAQTDMLGELTKHVESGAKAQRRFAEDLLKKN